MAKALRGTKMRLVSTPSPQHAAPLVGLTLRPNDAKGNAMRVRDRTGWPVLGGFALFEVQDEASAGAGRATGSAAAR